jgi:hypothetical protein
MKYVGYLQYCAKDIPAARRFLLDQIERNPVCLQSDSRSILFVS